MILLIGGTGYIGKAFRNEISRRELQVCNLTRCVTDYTNLDVLVGALEKIKPSLIINCAGYTGRPNVDACELDRHSCLMGNVALPAVISAACNAVGIPWGHVSSGCIYNGAHYGSGFNEVDRPNFTFRQSNCSFYSGTKAMGEDAIAGSRQCYVWRLRIPFDEFDGPRNYLSKLQRYPKVYQNVNTLSHRGDFARACLDLWEGGAPYGTYNVANPGSVSTGLVVDMIRSILKIDREFQYWKDDEEFYRVAAKAPRSNCTLDVSKLLAAGVKMRPIVEALEDSLCKWQPEA